jgi:hypothetical protein
MFCFSDGKVLIRQRRETKQKMKAGISSKGIQVSDASWPGYKKAVLLDMDFIFRYKI